MKIWLLLLLLVATVSGAPWLDILFGGQPDYNYRAPKNQFRRRQGKAGKERWKEICRTSNPDPFAFPGRAPYPSVPVCPW